MRAGVLAIVRPEVALGLGLLGIEGLEVTDARQARAALERALHARQAALVLVEEAHAEALQDLVEAAAQDPELPLVVELPSPEGARGTTPLRHRVERVLGLSLEG